MSWTKWATSTEAGRVCLRAKPANPSASDRTREAGDARGSEGRHEDALALLREAARADRFDPHARYLEGFALLHLQRPSEAVESYEAAEELAPGWFHCRSDLSLAREMVVGTIDHETFLVLHTLEDGAETPDEKMRLARKVLSRSPGLALAHLQHGRNLAKLGRSGKTRRRHSGRWHAPNEPDEVSIARGTRGHRARPRRTIRPAHSRDQSARELDRRGNGYPRPARSRSKRQHRATGTIDVTTAGV